METGLLRPEGIIVPVGRRRTRDLDLPPRLHRKGNAYYYVRFNRWEPLGSDKAEALRHWARLEGGASTVRTVSDLIDTYLARFGKDVAPSTMKNYQRQAATIRKYFGAAPVGAVTTGHIQEYLDTAPKKPEARNTVVLFSAMMKRAAQWEWRHGNPCADLERPKPSKRERYLTDAEFLAIREKLSEPYRIAMDLAYILSLAVSDVVKIRLADIKDGRLHVTRKKTGKRLDFEITPELEDVIARAKALPRPVRALTLLCSTRGKPYAPDTVSRAIKTAAKALGIEDVRFHDLRAKSASDEQDTAQKRLGHADPRTTQIYIRKPQPVTPIRRKL